MARKRKEENKKEYDILIGYINTFKFISEGDITRLGGHPHEGRLYRLLKDPFGWRLHLGRETNNEGLDGLFLGELEIYNEKAGTIKGEQSRYNFDISIVTPTNFLELTLEEEDREKLFKWIDTDNADLWENLNKEQKGESSVIRSGMDLLKVLMAQREAIISPEPEKKISGKTSASIADRERALEATLTLLTHFKNKKPSELVELFDEMFYRTLSILEGE